MRFMLVLNPQRSRIEPALGFFKGEIKMGRPLKIQKLSPASGIIGSANVGASVVVDAGFPNFNSLDPKTQVPPTGMTGTEYLGVVGGSDLPPSASATFPIVAVNAYFTDEGAETAATIITQKGQTKYLVASNNTVNDGTFTVGQSYIITNVGTTTNWTTIIGTANNPQVGDVFTARAAGGSGNGTASSVAVCYLTNVANGSLTAGQMNMSFTPDGGTTNIYASRLTNKYIWDDATPPNRYAVNFFVSGVNTAKSGADKVTWANGTGNLDLAVVQSYTS